MEIIQPECGNCRSDISNSNQRFPSDLKTILITTRAEILLCVNAILTHIFTTFKIITKLSQFQ